MASVVVVSTANREPSFTCPALMSGQTLYQRPVHCKYCNRLFDYPTYTLNEKEKGVPVRTRICRDCLWEMAHDDALLERRQASSQATQQNITSQSPQTSASEPSSNSCSPELVEKTSNTSSRRSTETTDDKELLRRDSGKRPLVLGQETSPDRRVHSDIHTLLN